MRIPLVQTILQQPVVPAREPYHLYQRQVLWDEDFIGVQRQLLIIHMRNSG